MSSCDATSRHIGEVTQLLELSPLLELEVDLDDDGALSREALEAAARESVR